ncbi:MAG: hypothetical protein KI792_08110 [Alphaproteobacteria bacterium]|nr:hypothetical protein [Alphaproteobacteria bacterium SS10]
MFGAQQLLAPRAETVALEVIGFLTGADKLPKAGKLLVHGQDAATAMVKRIDSALKHEKGGISGDAKALLTRARHGLDILSRKRSGRIIGEDSWIMCPEGEPSMPCPDWTGSFNALKRELEPTAQAVFQAHYASSVQDRHQHTPVKDRREHARHDQGLKIAMHMKAI